MTERIRTIEHGIVYLDFSNRTDPEPDMRLIEEAHRLIAAQSLGQALVLTDVSSSKFNQRTIEVLRDFVEANRPYVRASALVGLSSITRIIFRAVTALTRREIRACETRAEAIAYLLSKRVSGPAISAAASPRTPSGPRGGPR